MMLTICIDVLLRNLGYQSSAHFFTFTEYALLLVPCLGAPWLVREKGHVFVEIRPDVHARATRARRAIVCIGVACIVICLVMAWYGFEVTADNFRLDDKDVRSFDAPRWALVACIPIVVLDDGHRVPALPRCAARTSSARCTRRGRCMTLRQGSASRWSGTGPPASCSACRWR